MNARAISDCESLSFESAADWGFCDDFGGLSPLPARSCQGKAPPGCDACSPRLVLTVPIVERRAKRQLQRAESRRRQTAFEHQADVDQRSTDTGAGRLSEIDCGRVERDRSRGQLG